jgi:hypothetical protein
VKSKNDTPYDTTFQTCPSIDQRQEVIGSFPILLQRTTARVAEPSVLHPK